MLRIKYHKVDYIFAFEDLYTNDLVYFKDDEMLHTSITNTQIVIKGKHYATQKRKLTHIRILNKYRKLLDIKYVQLIILQQRNTLMGTYQIGTPVIIKDFEKQFNKHGFAALEKGIKI